VRRDWALTLHSLPPAPPFDPGVGHTWSVIDDESPEASQRDSEPPPGALGQDAGFSALRDRVPAEVRDVSFPTAVRGYDRRAVDAYVKQANTVIAELEVSRSPQAAVRHALDRVGEQTSGILQRARETAEEITASARTEADEATARAKAEADEISMSARAGADEVTARAKAEAEEILARSRAEEAERLKRLEEEVDALREQADTRMRKLDADTEAIWQERAELVDEIRQLAGRLEEIAGGAAARFPQRQPSEPPEEGMRPEGEAQAELAEEA
jgi:DivIVA domain-containing protein